jgi:hypothetical protein
MSKTPSGPVGDACPRPDDAHLRFEFVPIDSIDLGAELGAVPAPNERKRICRNALIIALLLTGWRDLLVWTAYSRDHNIYTGLRFYLGPAFSYACVMWSVETLAQAGLIEHRRVAPGRDLPFRSTIRATPALVEGSPILHVGQLKPVVSEPIRLKDLKRKLVEYSDTSLIREWRKDVQEQNEALSTIAIEWHAPEWRLTCHGLLSDGRRTVNPTRRSYYRVFNLDWRHGGRFYGHFVQGLPAGVRSQLTIDGQAVVEVDYPRLHPALLAAMSGRELHEDPYVIDGFKRDDIKTAFNVLLNANSEARALRALRREFARRGRFEPSRYATRVAEAIKAKHSDFDNAWGTGVGLRLQAVDAQMCGAVQRRMRKIGQPVMSIHDSFIAPAAHEQHLREAMDDVLQRTKRALAQGQSCTNLRL